MAPLLPTNVVAGQAGHAGLHNDENTILNGLVTTPLRIPAALLNNAGTAATTSVFNGAHQAWLLDADAVERISGYTPPIPGSWQTVNINMFWGRASVGSGGDAAWLLRADPLPAPGAAPATPTTGTQVVATAGSAQFVIVKTALATAKAVTPGTSLALYLTRIATDAADTLTGDAAVFWLEVERAS